MKAKSKSRDSFNVNRRALMQQGAMLTAGVIAGIVSRRADAAEMLETYSPAMPRESLGPLQQATEPTLGLIIGPGTVLNPDGSPNYFLSVIDLDAADGREYPLHKISLEFFGHGVVPVPFASEQAVVFQKKGKGACEVDLVAGEVIRPIATAQNRKFYGHGAFSRDGNLLYATETIVEWLVTSRLRAD